MNIRIPYTNIHIVKGAQKRGHQGDSFLVNGLMNPFSHAISGVSITKKNVLKIAAFYAGVRVITDAISSLPTWVIRVDGETRIRDRDHPLFPLLAREPNALMTAYVWNQIMIPWLLIYGNAYAIIEFEGGSFRPISLLPVHPDRVKVELRDGLLWYTFKMSNGKDFVLDQSNVLHYRGLGDDLTQGKSVIDFAKDNLGGGLAAENFGSTFFGNGANMNGALESDKSFSQDAIRNIRESIQSIHGGISRSNKLLILEEGIKFKNTSIPPEQAQFLETRKFSVNDVARWLKLPPHMIGDLEKATFSNIEQQDLNFVKHSILPWVINIEQENNKKLLREDEKGIIFTKKNLDGLLRGDLKTRTEAYKIQIQNGIISPNEARAMEEMNAYEGGSSYWMPLNTAPISEEGTNQSEISSNTTNNITNNTTQNGDTDE